MNTAPTRYFGRRVLASVAASDRDRRRTRDAGGRVRLGRTSTRRTQAHDRARARRMGQLERLERRVTKLQRRGYPVIAPANPLRSLSSDAAYVSSVLDTIEGPIVLVGHSYGGAVITNAAVGHDNVEALVYIAAFAPDAGESLMQLVTMNPGSEIGPNTLITRPYPLPDGTQGTDLYLTREGLGTAFAADVPRKTRTRCSPPSGPSRKKRSRAHRASPPGRRSRPGTSSRATTAPSRRRHSGSWPSEPERTPARCGRRTSRRSLSLPRPWTSSSTPPPRCTDQHHHLHEQPPAWPYRCPSRAALWRGGIVDTGRCGTRTSAASRRSSPLPCAPAWRSIGLTGWSSSPAPRATARPGSGPSSLNSNRKDVLLLMGAGSCCGPAEVPAPARWVCAVAAAPAYGVAGNPRCSAGLAKVPGAARRTRSSSRQQCRRVEAPPGPARSVDVAADRLGCLDAAGQLGAAPRDRRGRARGSGGPAPPGQPVGLLLDRA